MEKKCIECLETKEHYAKGWCRPCYRKNTGEHEKAYAKTKKDPTLLKKRAEASSRSHTKRMADPKKADEYKKLRRNRLRTKYNTDPKWRAERREYLNKWKRNLPKNKKRQYMLRDMATAHFGSWENVQNAMDKFDNKCVDCGMTNDESKEKWGQRLTIHHKDGRGRPLPKELKNNDLSNFLLFCKSCHQKWHRALMAKEKGRA